MHTPVTQWHTAVHTDICTLISQFLFFKKSSMHIITWPKRHMTSLKDAPEPSEAYKGRATCWVPASASLVGLGLKSHPKAIISQWDSSDKMPFFFLSHFLLSRHARLPDQPQPVTAEPRSSSSSHWSSWPLFIFLQHLEIVPLTRCVFVNNTPRFMLCSGPTQTSGMTQATSRYQ